MKSFIHEPFKSKISKTNTHYSAHYKDKDKPQAIMDLSEKVSELSKLQDILYAHDRHALLVVIQGMDASGKDSLVKNVFSGINPQGMRVHSFKTPTSTELDHDFMWRCYNKLPERGMIGVFNRSYYEEVLIARVHRDILAKQKLPVMPSPKNERQFWLNRFNAINDLEKHLTENGTHIIKIFLQISKNEQKQRFLRRINNQEKQWKIAVSDIKERQYWNDYMECYQDILDQTSKENIPWHVVPADKKWYARVAVADIILEKLKSLDIFYPKVDEDVLKEINEAKHILESE
ncbi:MAG: polyphosphate kinase 2 family protein [Bacteroidales bacterium]|nr:polyphosphate kinase 2 family protein [Bacteroidales bacterium]MDD4575446.1 polyphosphate kinase 2 family protein [Bacteroidales bacterium]